MIFFQECIDFMYMQISFPMRHTAARAFCEGKEFEGNSMSIEPNRTTRGPTAVLPEPPPPWLDGVLRALEADVTAELSMTDIAVSANLSKSYFFRTFRRSVGYTPHQWRLRLRIAAAQFDLIELPDGIAQIAQRYGFSDQAHFTRVFRRFVGKTPNSWLANEARNGSMPTGLRPRRCQMLASSVPADA
ncbi:AraC family transcriptional regulator [Paraburkholderia sp. JHI2823]|uniref:helix-turn-helix transcriptional regulator n=1 Tax=Paraburkholderia sp. JHI2823 TaxID=3112960 RepID=UPI00316F29D9